MREIVQNSAATVMMLLVDSTSHVTGMTGLALTDASVTISKVGSSFATRGAVTTIPAERGNGWYEVSLGSDDTNFVGDLVIHLSASGCDPTDRLVAVVVADATVANVTATSVGASLTAMRTFYTDARAPKLDNLTGSVALDSTVAKDATVAKATVLGTPMQTTTAVTLATSQPNYAPATVASLATLSAAVSAIPVDTLLATDTRLNYLDASISSRLATGAPLVGGATAVWAYHNGGWVNVGGMVVFRPVT